MIIHEMSAGVTAGIPRRASAPSVLPRWGDPRGSNDASSRTSAHSADRAEIDIERGAGVTMGGDGVPANNQRRQRWLFATEPDEIADVHAPAV